MNGDVKEEAHRPRPLSGGIWTLFSWLRRSERSSSSESLSSVGSARTAVSFDFLSPGHCNFTKTPVILSTPLSPPTETYKKRLQERNLRRQRDRDITLHRKYGLFREHGNGYDGFSLPPARKLLGNTEDRQNRERRATSESLQRRAAYVPGKRRAPLPPILVTSASLPRSYKRKRPAPKPPVKTIIEESFEIQINPVRMNSNLGSNGTSNSDYDILVSKNIEKCEKNDTSSKDSKSRIDKSFFKHIFENKKRNSAIDSTPVKLLPSISELDKQAAEIVESNKLRKYRNHESTGNAESSSMPYEGNSWICTLCLRKYTSSINSCNYCDPKKNNLNINVEKCGIKSSSSLRSSIYTQTNNVETASTSSDERKMLKEILKEMKDSLPKKHRDKNSDIKILDTETPTLRIGTKVTETYKDLIYQPSSSNENKNVNGPKVSVLQNRILSVSPLLPEKQRKNDKGATVVTRNIIDHKVSLQFKGHENKSNVQNGSSKTCVDSKDRTPVTLYGKPKEPAVKISNVVLNEIKMSNDEIQETHVLKITENRNEASSHLKLQNNKSMQESSLPLCLDTNENKKTDSENISNNHRIVISDNQTQVALTTSKTNESNNSINDIPISPLTKISLINKKCLESSKEFTAYKDAQPSTSTNKNVLQGSNVPLKTSVKSEPSPSKYTEPSISSVKLESIHTPLKISTLLNPLYSPRLPVINELENAKVSEKTITSATVNKEAVEKVPSQIRVKPRQDLTEVGNDLIAPAQKKGPIRPEPALPSTSAGSNSVSGSTDDVMDKFDRRRHLVNQLEQSIARGDEAGAAEAAVKLAQLKLSCSVLSFSSQIVADTQNQEVTKQSISQQDTETLPSTTTTHVENVIKTDVKEHENEAVKGLLSSNGNKLNNMKPDDYNKPSSSTQGSTNDNIPIDVWIEDKQAARGPIRLYISRRATMAELRQHAERSLGLATHMQRWIIGRTLCTDDANYIASLAGTDFGAPFYLCVVQSEPRNKAQSTTVKDEIKHGNVEQAIDNNDFYTELMKLEQQSLVRNVEPFECSVCMEECAAGAGVVLRECIHTFCKECLSDVVQHCQEPVVPCPAMGCSGFLQEREIRTIVSPEEYERWLARSLATAECGTRNTFHCRTRDCTGWAFCDPGVRRFPCPVCKHTNCVQCQAIHEDDTCEQYQIKLRETVTAAETYKDDEGTQALLNSLIARGEALECPECRAIITKKWGCDWVKCSACKTEICWVTKGRRWGPGGRGDISGGCRCGVNGQRCHPSCGYCH